MMNKVKSNKVKLLIFVNSNEVESYLTYLILVANSSWRISEILFKQTFLGKKSFSTYYCQVSRRFNISIFSFNISYNYERKLSDEDIHAKSEA